MKTRLIITIITNILYEVAIVAGIIWLLPKMGVKIPWWGTLLCVLAFALYAAVFFQIGNRTLRKNPMLGLTNMTGTEGIVINCLRPEGLIKIGVELWAAESETGQIEVGLKVEVIGQKELKLLVREKGK